MVRLPLLVALAGLVGPLSAEVFSSTARLEALFDSTEKMEEMLNNYIQQEEARLASIRSLMGQVKSMANRTAGERVKFVEHPLGAFNLIKTYSQIGNEIARGNETKEDLFSSLDSQSLSLPTEEDHMGSASAILRLQRIYQLPKQELMQGYVRERFIQPLGIDDALTLGAKAQEQNFFTQAIEWYDVPLRVPVEQEAMVTAERIEATLGLISVYLQFNDLESALKFSRWASEAYPYDDRVHEVHADIQRKVEGVTFGQLELPPPADAAGFDEQYAALCRGEVDWTNPYLSKGLCIARADTVPYRLVKQEILSFDPFISVFYDVLSENEGNNFRNTAKKHLNRAMVGDPDSSMISEVRVGQLTWLDDSEPAIKKISDRVMEITGLDVTMRTVQSSSESFQIVNYGIGGHYEPHTDTYQNRSVLAQVPDFLQNTGDRLATFLFYLDDVVEGGATVFPRVGIQVPVVKNGAAFWYNLNRAGENDERLTHAGCPVLLGQKWVANKWIREHGQEFRHRCGLTPTTPHFTS